MPNAEMHAIKVEHPPMHLQRTLPPRVKLMAQALIELTDGAGTGRHSQQRLGDFPNLVCARSCYEHLRQSFGDVWFIAAVAVKGLGVELTFPIVFAL